MHIKGLGGATKSDKKAYHYVSLGCQHWRYNAPFAVPYQSDLFFVNFVQRLEEFDGGRGITSKILAMGLLYNPVLILLQRSLSSIPTVTDSSI